MKTPFFSIIIPIYNSCNFLNNCIDSIIAQNFKDYEILLINDGSTDKSGEICNHYCLLYDNIYVYHKKNGGVSSARNLGLEKAKGKWIWFVDSDDTITANALNIIYQSINKGSALIYSFAVNVITPNKHIIINNIENKLKSEYILKKLLTYKFLGAPFFYIYNRELIYNLRFPTNLKIGEDLYFNLNVLNKYGDNEIIYDKKIIYNHIENESSVMMNKKTPFVEYFSTLTYEVKQFLLQNNIYDNFRQEYIIFRSTNIFYSHIRTKTTISKTECSVLLSDYHNLIPSLTKMQRVFLKISRINYKLGVLFFKIWMAIRK